MHALIYTRRMATQWALGPLLSRFDQVLPAVALPHMLAAIAAVQLPPSSNTANNDTQQPPTAAASTTTSSAPPQGRRNAVDPSLRDLLLAALYRDGVPQPPQAPEASDVDPPQPLSVPAAALSSLEGLTQGERDARVEGCGGLLVQSVSIQRLLQSCQDWQEVVVYALLASRAHNSSVAQVGL